MPRLSRRLSNVFFTQNSSTILFHDPWRWTYFLPSSRITGNTSTLQCITMKKIIANISRVFHIVSRPNFLQTSTDASVQLLDAQVMSEKQLASLIDYYKYKPHIVYSFICSPGQVGNVEQTHVKRFPGSPVLWTVYSAAKIYTLTHRSFTACRLISHFYSVW